MAQVRLDDSTLHSIAAKIREKNKEEASYKPSEMPDAIDRILVNEPTIESLEVTANGTYEAPLGVHGYNPVVVNTPSPSDEDLVFTGNCQYLLSYDNWNWFMDMYKDRIQLSDITTADYMFKQCIQLKEIPFTINIKDATSFTETFAYCTNLMVSPKIRGTILWNSSTSLQNMLIGCKKLRNIDDLFLPEMFDGFKDVVVSSTYTSPKAVRFSNMESLRTVPEWFYKQQLNPDSTAFPYSSYCIYYSMAEYCCALDEFINIPVWTCTATQTSNMFNSAFNSCYRLARITFETNEDGSAKVANWKNQTIDLSKYIGYANSNSSIVNDSCNNGITMDKYVLDDEHYQALKDDPDWFTTLMSFSRYNYTSALETIRTLPDCSANGVTNTIKFKGDCGSNTDGGAINQLTAEDIAIAEAKGWKVTLV